ncbi:flagellar hook-associated protein FlgK [Betaproteobacteria bacterium PRO7]|jgi:flagellar hook-associated protein 1 FlgK|nr:flagellar hook-associated protein FlgK [Betaproteobacteria bacterium PRO7]
MSTGIFSIGTSALNAAYTALRTAGNNVANANTPGYSRQITVLTPQVGTFLGGNYVGQGVAVTDVRRVYNDFLAQQAHQAQAAASQSDTRYLQLVQVSNLFADPTAGVGATIDQFFRAVQDLTQRPADPATRQALLSAANLMAARFNDVGDRLQEFRNGTDQQLRLEIDAVNRAAREIAELNDMIALARGAGRSPNDLLDRRDTAIRRLNESVRVSMVEQDDGAVNLFLANGQPLVVGNQASEVGMTIDPIDPQNVLVGIRSGASVIPLDPDRIGGGKIAGLLQFRTGDLPQIENELGRLAVALSAQFNQQHRLGDDRNGQPGGDFFAPLTANAFAAGTNGNPATTLAVTFADATRLAASDYRIDYTGGTYWLTRLADGARIDASTLPGYTASGGNVAFTYEGLRFALAGAPPANGDVFLAQPLRAAARSFDVALAQPAQIAAASPVQAQVPATNLGSIVVDDLSVVGPTRNPALANATTITFTGPNTYTISDGVTTLTGQTYTPGAPIVFNGWSLALRGTPQANDRVTVGANIGGIGDNRNAIRLSQLANLALVDGSQLAGAFAAVVARVGAVTQSADIYNAAQQSILQDAVNAESAVSGVNLDEEASRLMQFQQQYQAAAKVVATAKVIFEEILSIAR